MGRNNAKKLTLPLKSKLKKDPGVPRLPDLKVRNAEKQRRRSSPPHDPPHEDATMASEPTLTSLAQLAMSASTNDELSASWKSDRLVVDEADVILLVLDARDPAGCRSRLVEEEVRRREAEGKRLVFVLNKIDLVPRENAQAWLKHLRHTTPTLPFRSAGSHQRANLASNTAPALLRLLKAYKPSAAQSITVGVVGFPNVGKSSLINTLKRAKVCAVAAQPGHTKELQSIQLERGLRIVDSPGVIFDDDDSIQGQQESSVLLRNVVKPEDIDDPISVVEQILARTQTEKLMKIYNLPAFNSTLEFLTMLALSAGRLLKGGTPDILTAARQVIIDWNQQKIPFFSEPPTLHATHRRTGRPGAEATGNAQILSELGTPFVLEGLFGEADAEAMDAEPELAGEGQDAGMEVEEEVTIDWGIRGMAIDNDDDKSKINENNDLLSTSRVNNSSSSSRKRPRARSHSPTLDSGGDELEFELDPDMVRAPKRLRRLAVRRASLPTAAVAVRSRRAERVAHRKRERALLLGRATSGRGMEVDNI
ncbi:P-loop containing nucleoside triphosphate hydrolase protein [Multifurca ochricompacta]|uniref:P-loop containing nucleoside triphosphate hydrolase protein n=1 Tax=Multifurca ochricompacta TaxID=376703 RepID=A0AAD4LXC9_9AGAM|nr:P-loop containing nucleoside triphosphate hydrolase protein [Multifurca ochricompacta]